ncbi:MAG: hypothetical protein CMJ76_09940 [Planctomycetaceae bacterium]|nr:hypothetical protein [Planctomycetaceae bacterium]|tara:strand:- start:896 stop:1282 length:387 start_codon:yes stop_codon:yes gene_type:complete
MLNRLILTAVALLISSSLYAGTGYEVTSKIDGETRSYMVIFGGGRLFEQYTAFDPETKKFVYLRWSRTEKSPQPVARIWNHSTGEMIQLFKFPEAENPLPLIPSIKAMKVCPLTGSKDFTVMPRLAID